MKSLRQVPPPADPKQRLAWRKQQKQLRRFCPKFEEGKIISEPVCQ
jgi:hypothetical protein